MKEKQSLGGAIKERKPIVFKKTDGDVDVLYDDGDEAEVIKILIGMGLIRRMTYPETPSGCLRAKSEKMDA